MALTNTSPPKEEDLEILNIDNSRVRDEQIARLHAIRANRDDQRVRASLDALTAAAQNETGNLLALSIEAARARATVGEITHALEKVWGRYHAVARPVSGVYGSAYEGDEPWRKIQAGVVSFAEDFGRRPRILVVKLGQDGHDRGAKVIATAFADLGFDVDIGPLFQTPEEAARQAIESDCHVVGASSQAAGHMTLVPHLIQALRDQGADDIPGRMRRRDPATGLPILTRNRRRRGFWTRHQHSRRGRGDLEEDPRKGRKLSRSWRKNQAQ